MSDNESNETINETHEEEEEHWEDLKNHPDYEICTSYPYNIRKKSNKTILKEWLHKSTGYLCYTLNRKQYLKHRLLGIHFIKNDDPEHKTEIDHKNTIRTDNRLENLRWVSVQMNNKNPKSRNQIEYVYYDELPETAEQLDSYNGYDFDSVYVDYENEKVYLFNGVRYRELIGNRRGGNIRYGVRDIENNRRELSHKVLFG